MRGPRASLSFLLASRLATASSDISRSAGGRGPPPCCFLAWWWWPSPPSSWWGTAPPPRALKLRWARQQHERRTPQQRHTRSAIHHWRSSKSLVVTAGHGSLTPWHASEVRWAVRPSPTAGRGCGAAGVVGFPSSCRPSGLVGEHCLHRCCWRCCCCGLSSWRRASPPPDSIMIQQ